MSRKFLQKGSFVKETWVLYMMEIWSKLTRSMNFSLTKLMYIFFLYSFLCQRFALNFVTWYNEAFNQHKDHLLNYQKMVWTLGHLSMFCCLSGAELRWQQVNQGSTDILLPAKVSSGEMRYKISLQCSWSTQDFHTRPDGCAWKRKDRTLHDQRSEPSQPAPVQRLYPVLSDAALVTQHN